MNDSISLLLWGRTLRLGADSAPLAQKLRRGADSATWTSRADVDVCPTRRLLAEGIGDDLFVVTGVDGAVGVGGVGPVDGTEFAGGCRSWRWA